MLDVHDLIISPNMKRPVVEAYKTLRTNLQFSGLNQELRVILTTSAKTAEGKSTTTSNLAISIAQNGQRVLLMDCDLRKPSLHRAFGIVNEKGITNILAENLDFRSIVQKPGIPNLEILTSGPVPPNPPELLGSHKMENLIADTLNEYQVVLIDAPPILPVTDAAVLSRYVNGVILVIDHGRTSIKDASMAKEALVKVGANIIGTVINNMPSNYPGYYSYYYNNYYSDYTEDNYPKRKKGMKRRKSAKAKV
ncbi:MAG: CpsD/CapB family tyrosine-protein kinase [Caldicoprobacterales bacterium]|jgi:capsular exopolysaccharide synthesis family protein